MNATDKVYQVIEASLNDDAERMARLCSEMSVDGIREVIGSGAAGLTRPVDFLSDEDVLAMLRVTRTVITQIGVLLQVRNADPALAREPMRRMDIMLGTLIEWITSCAIANGYLPHEDGRRELDVEVVKVDANDKKVSEVMASMKEGAFDA